VKGDWQLSGRGVGDQRGEEPGDTVHGNSAVQLPERRLTHSFPRSPLSGSAVCWARSVDGFFFVHVWVQFCPPSLSRVELVGPFSFFLSLSLHYSCLFKNRLSHPVTLRGGT